MAKETEDNTSQEVDNTTPEEKEPNFPDLEKEQPKQEEQETQPQDPELAEWLSQEKEKTYKRYQDSSSEAKKYREQLEQVQAESKRYQEQLATELQAVYEKDPETASKLFGLQQQVEEKQVAETQPPAVDSNEISRQVQAQVELNRFYDKNAEYIKDDDDWNAIQDIAMSFVGKTDDKGKTYNINSALRDALLLRHKELIGDKAISEHLTSQAKRASASESGDTPSGSTEGDELGQEYYDTAELLGFKITDEVKQRIQNQNREQ